MASLQHDLILTAGRVFDSTLDLDSPGAVAIQAGVITAVGPEVSGEAEARLDFPDGIISVSYTHLTLPTILLV